MLLRTSVLAVMSTLFAGLSVGAGLGRPAGGASSAPTQSPNPYQTIDNWGALPGGRTWGGTSAVDIDRDGRSVWVAERCGGQSCADSSLAPILKLDRSGAVVASFGAGLFVVPHGIDVDADGNVWVTDASDGINKVPGKGHQVFKFSPEGKVLLVLGKPGVFGDGPGVFNRPSDVLVAPNGDVFVADGHGGNVADSLSGSERHPGWVRGIRIGSVTDGKLTAFIPDRTPVANPITAAEGVAVDADGNVFGAVVPAQMLQKHIRR
jgi:sugar lactone lactonase YvrE